MELVLLSLTHPCSVSHSAGKVAPEGIEVLGHILGRRREAGGEIGVGAALDGRVEGLREDVL